MAKALTNTKYKDLTHPEKVKVRNCSKWNFYSKKCKTCRFELICAEQWQVREWLGDKAKREQQEKTRLLQDIEILLNNIKESSTKATLSLEQLVSIKNNLQIATEKNVEVISKPM